MYYNMWVPLFWVLLNPGLKKIVSKKLKTFIRDILEQLGKFEYGLDIKWFLWN